MRRYKTGLFLAVILTLAVSVIWAAPPQQGIPDFGGFVNRIRADLERLANDVSGEGIRPEGWTGNVDNRNLVKFVADMWFDNELLANQLSGSERPPGWIGAPITSNAVIVARNLRHDLELSADQQYGRLARPQGWQGAAPRFRCSRTLQNLLEILSSAYNVNFTTADSVANFCAQIGVEADEQVLRIALNTPEIQDQIPDLLLAVRGDLERLADEELGLNVRPPNWIGNKDRNSVTLPSDNFLDMELLADSELGANVRPPGWIGLLPNTRFFAYRNLRHDLELLANTLGRAPRPRGWQGTDPLSSCEPITQNLVIMAIQAYGFSTIDIQQDAGFCQRADLSANQLIENPPAAAVAEREDDRFLAESRYAFTYLDAAATQYMGPMPFGTKFKAWYRNYGDSTMMFVSGDDFAVYIDLRWTTLAAEIFNRLPTTEGVVPRTFCDASWCNGPSSTPTPTGSGAIAALLAEGTVPPQISATEVSTQKTQVSWNNLRVTYVLDNQATRTAQVTLEICTDTQQMACEPVIQVFDNGTGTLKPVISQFNGLNVYEFPYGYTSNLVIEGTTLFSPDVWISDPTIR